MPLMFSKMSGGIFVLFVLLVLFLFFLPLYFGYLGKELLESQKKSRNEPTKTSINRPVSQSAVTKIDKSLQFLDWEIVISFIVFLFALLISFVLPSISLNLLFLLISIFFLSLMINSWILLNCDSDSKLKKNNSWCLSLLSTFISAFGGSFFILLYLVVTQYFLKNSSDMVFTVCILPPVLSSISFWVFCNKKYFELVLFGSIPTLVLLMGFFQNRDLSDAYFRWAGYGQIPVIIVVAPNLCMKSPETSYVGRILFNSGSDLYVTLNPAQNGISPLSKIYLKQGKFPKKIEQNQVIEISYKDLQTIPRF